MILRQRGSARRGTRHVKRCGNAGCERPRGCRTRIAGGCEALANAPRKCRCGRCEAIRADRAAQCAGPTDCRAPPVACTHLARGRKKWPRAARRCLPRWTRRRMARSSQRASSMRRKVAGETEEAANAAEAAVRTLRQTEGECRQIMTKRAAMRSGFRRSTDADRVAESGSRRFVAGHGRRNQGQVGL